MVDINAILNAVAKITRERQEQISPINSAEDGVYLFFSFDLSNSTPFKVEYPELWGSVVTEFYEQVLKLTVSANYKDSRSIGIRNLWKLIGDEVLIYTRIQNPKDLYAQVKDVAECQKNILEFVSETLEKRLSSTCKYYKDIKFVIESRLGIKVTAWVAYCVAQPTEKAANIIYTRDEELGSTSRIDFLGREIDEGFRIARVAAKNQMIVSPLLAWLIWKEEKRESDEDETINKKFKITSYMHLKGVWDNRPVPIVMYHDDFEKIEDTLSYDDVMLSDVYKSLRDTRVGDFISDSRFMVSRLDKILEDIHRKKEYTDWYDFLCTQQNSSQYVKKEVTLYEFHIACAVFSLDGKKLLVHKHSDRGLEFGGMVYKNLRPSTSWEEFCELRYRQKYSIEIKVRENPTPVSTYTYIAPGINHEVTKCAFGVIVIAELNGDLENKPDWELYTIEMIRNLKNEKTVANFKENALKAFNAFQIEEKEL